MERPFDPAQDGNLFPREDLLEAVARADWRDQPVPLAAWLALAAGLSALAAGAPLARVVVPGFVEGSVAWSSAERTAAPLLAGVAVVGEGLGIGIEAALMLASALSAGALFAALGLALAAFGFRGRLRLVAALTGVAAPLVAVGARLPLTTVVVAAASALALAAATAPVDPGARGARGFGVRVGAAVLAATLVSPWACALAVPAAFALRARAAFPAAAAWTALPFAALAALAVALAPAVDAPAALPAWIATGALVIAWPANRVRAAEETGAPAHLHLWAAAGLAIAPFDAAGAALALPALVVFLADVLARRARPDGAARLALVAFGLQVALAVFATAQLERYEGAFARERGDVLPSDVVVVDDVESTAAYLLRRRIGATVIMPSDALPANAPRVLWASAAPAREGSRALDLRTGRIAGERP